MSRKENILMVLALIIVSFLFLLVYSTSTSPLYVGAFSDSAYFLVLGRFFLLGKIPYVDYFDHKGPILIFIEAFGQLLHPDERTGVFILQTVLLSGVLAVIYKLSRTYLNKLNSAIVVISSLCFLALVFGDGNLSEEYSLLFIILPFYFTARCVFSQECEITVKQFVLIGICFGVIFWLRVNNAAVICACILYFVWNYISRREWGQLAKMLMAAFLGFMLVSVLMISYFLYIGAFDEMIYATFLFNIEYARRAVVIEGDTSPASVIVKIRELLIRFIPIVFFILGVVFYYFKNNRKRNVFVFSLFLLFFAIIATQIGIKSLNYLIILLPLVVFSMILLLLLNKRRGRTKSIFVSIIILFVLLSSLKLYQKRNYNETQLAYMDEVGEVMQFIPEEDRDRVMAYQTTINFFFYSKLPPYSRYFVSQDRHGCIDHRIFDATNSVIENSPAKWLVLEYKGNEARNTRFPELRDLKYERVFENHSFLIYRLKDNALQ